MSYCGYDANGYLGSLASTGGWAAFVKWAERQKGPVRTFVEEGFTEDLAGLAKALTLGSLALGDVEVVRVGVLTFAGRADEVLIVWDGLG